MRNHLLASFGVVLSVMLMAGTGSAASSAPEKFVEVLGYDELGDVSADNPLEYSHTFAPASLETGDPVEVQSVRLSILLSECTQWVGCRYDLRSEGEWAVIDVEGTEIHNDALRLVTFVDQDVTLFAKIAAAGDEIDITISSTGTDSFAAVFSVAEISYYAVSPGSTGGTVPMPEPSAALAFGVGLLVLSRRLRSS